MARKEALKTELAQRLTDVRKALGFERREDLSNVLGVKLTTLGSYERGDREPDSQFYAAYINRFNVNGTWLLTGKGVMFGNNDHPSNENMLQLHAETLRKMARLAQKCYSEAGQSIEPEQIAVKALDLYYELYNVASHVLDQEEVDSLLPYMEFIMKKKFMGLEEPTKPE